MPDTAPSPGKWGDLGTRIASAVVMLAVTIGALWAGGLVWAALVVIVAVLMGWELAPLCEPGVDRVRRAVLALAFAVPLVLYVPVSYSVDAGNAPGMLGLVSRIVILLPPLLGGALLREARMIWAGYSLMVVLGALFFLAMGLSPWGGFWLVFVVTTVIISDTLGYFTGRLIGGAKFWPRVSPKKTWSGTVAGWIGAAVFGAVMGSGAPLLGPVLGAIAAALIAFAGQMGDIAESAIKRRVGVKDASNIIPGHGGFMDRLDAMIAAGAVTLLGLWLF
ncbi:MAG: phosphatidate cytidylyltransferase [Maritimibacter sp.]|nr:phosphatidate cytidylyltransferase [Maritimibacter sp.]